MQQLELEFLPASVVAGLVAERGGAFAPSVPCAHARSCGRDHVVVEGPPELLAELASIDRSARGPVADPTCREGC